MGFWCKINGLVHNQWFFRVKSMVLVHNQWFFGVKSPSLSLRAHPHRPRTPRTAGRPSQYRRTLAAGARAFLPPLRTAGAAVNQFLMQKTSFSNDEFISLNAEFISFACGNAGTRHCEKIAPTVSSSTGFCEVSLNSPTVAAFAPP